jgi:uncharacterized protein (DUF2147 family)
VKYGMDDGKASCRRLLVGAVAAGVLAGLAPRALRAATPPDAILGTWLTDDGASKVEIVAAKAADGSSVYSGKLVWLKQPLRDGRPLSDQHNADAALRGRPILGLQILSGFKAGGAGWSGGTVYAPKAGKSFPAELSLAGDGRLQLKVSAGLLSRTDYWTR